MHSSLLVIGVKNFFSYNNICLERILNFFKCDFLEFPLFLKNNISLRLDTVDSTVEFMTFHCRYSFK